MDVNKPLNREAISFLFLSNEGPRSVRLAHRSLLRFLTDSMLRLLLHSLFVPQPPSPKAKEIKLTSVVVRTGQNSTSSASTPSVFPLVLGGSSAEAYLGNDTFTALGVDAEEDYTVGNQAVSGEFEDERGKGREERATELTSLLLFLVVATESSGLFYYDGSQGIFGLGVGVSSLHSVERLRVQLNSSFPLSQSTNLSLSSTLLGNRLNNGSFPYFTVGVDLGRPDISQSAPQTSDGGRVSWGGVEEGRVEGGGDSL